MIQKINFKELRKSDNGWDELIFIRTIMAAGDIEGTPDSVYDLEFTVQGKTVDFHKFCKMFGHNYDKAVNDAAAEQLKNLASLGNLQEIVSKFEKEVKKQAVKILVENFKMEEYKAEEKLSVWG